MEDTMDQFLSKFGSVVTGVLSGLDRLVFRGTLRSINFVDGLVGYLLRREIKFIDFGKSAESESKKLIEASLMAARKQQRPIRHLQSSGLDKNKIACEIAQQDRIEAGLVCVLKVVEPCYSYELHRDREQKKARIEHRKRKCPFLCHYGIDPEFGLMNARIQTWLPYPIQICRNGREWLSRQMDRAGIAYRREDNCFPWIQDVEAAQC